MYDDVNAAANQEEGRRLLEHLQKQAASANVPMVTQVRIAANIANGIKHAFKEFQASEIVMGTTCQTSYIERLLGTIYTEPLQWFEPPNYNSSYCATIEYNS